MMVNLLLRLRFWIPDIAAQPILQVDRRGRPNFGSTFIEEVRCVQVGCGLVFAVLAVCGYPF